MPGLNAGLNARFEDPAFYLDDPEATYRWLRANEPVHWYEEGRFWVLTKHDDIKFVSTHPRLFSSKRIAVVSNLVDRMKGSSGAAAAGLEPAPSVMFMDPPEHSPYRKAVSFRFTPREVGTMEDRVRSVIRSVVASVPDDEFDLVSVLAEPIPVFVFAAILGVPEGDWQQIVKWATTITNLGGGQGAPEDYEIVINEIGPYLWALISERQQRPTDDLLSLLTTTTVHGRRLTEEEMITYAMALLAAGSETTQSLITGLAHVLHHFPEPAGALYRDPSVAPAAVEETLRWWTPVISMAREATSDVPLRDVTIRKGDGVLLLYGSANRDEERWGDDADDFRLDRPDAAGHLSFGIGEHFCMGVHLARREARIFLEELVAATRGIEVVGEGTPRRSALMHSYEHLPVRVLR
jgi:cytochrome P450